MSQAPFGVLLLHGLSSHISCIDPVVPRLVKHGLPYRMPILRGHGRRPSDLEGVKWQDWLEDGQKAFDELLTECEKVIVVSLSMGSLVGINLTIANGERMGGLVCIAPALKMRSPLTPLVPLISRVQKTYRPKFDPKSYFDLEQAMTSQNYKEMPSGAVVELVRFIKHTRPAARLSQIKAPTLILQSTADRTVDPRIAQYLLDTISSQDKKLVWFHKSGHEMLRDGQREVVLDEIEAFVGRLAGVEQPQKTIG